MTQDKPQHPGRTPAQRRALDTIGCGNPSPVMTPGTRRALLAAGLIEEIGHQIIGRDRFGAGVTRDSSTKFAPEPKLHA